MMTKKVNIDIKLQKGQTPEEAEELLYKALAFQRSGDIHGDEFLDPVMQDASQKMIKMHEKVWTDSLNEILALLDEEYE